MPIVICANCHSSFEKAAWQIKKCANHFCSRSCAAQMNNRLTPKRSKTGLCKKCGALVSASRAYCQECWSAPKPKAEMPPAKLCLRCSEVKPATEFYTKNRATGSTQQFCKSCFNAYCIRRWKRRKVDAVTYLGGQCQDCGGIFHPNVYDFLHLRDKDFVWDKLRLRSWGQLKLELDKCALLCANCHRMRHVEADGAEKKE